LNLRILFRGTINNFTFYISNSGDGFGCMLYGKYKGYVDDGSIYGADGKYKGDVDD